jgi:uridine phosphorylase
MAWSTTLALSAHAVIALVTFEVSTGRVSAALSAALAALRTSASTDAGSAPEHEGPPTATKVFLSPDMPVDAEGRTYHLQTRPGEVASRILSVGDVCRASRIAAWLTDVRTFTSTRGFVTHTGLYHGVAISIIATGMGTPMADFMMRECRAVVEGPMVVLRFGTCGGLGDSAPGTIVVAEGSVLIRRDPDAVGDALASGRAWGGGSAVGHAGGRASEDFPYSVSRTVFPDARLTAAYASALRRAIEPLGPPFAVTTGGDATADSFYSSQGREGSAFADSNSSLLDRLAASHPTLATLQMETFHLFDLGRSASASGTIATAAAAIVLVHRASGAAMAKEDLATAEMHGGKAALDTLAGFKLS